jgi:hypothetical protein
MAATSAELENWRKQASKLSAKAKGFGVIIKDDGPGGSTDAALAGMTKVGPAWCCRGGRRAGAGAAGAA